MSFLVCSYCRHPAQGNHAIHRDRSMDGPEVPLCDRCGSSTGPSCDTIWEQLTDDAQPLAVPTVHLNGTDGPTLIAQLVKAVRALNSASQALIEARPHDRDYYVQKDKHAYSKAQGQHTARLYRLADVTDEVQAILRDVTGQHHRRKHQ